MTLGSRTRGTAALVAIPAALMLTFGGVAAASDGDGGSGGSGSDPVSSVVSGVTGTTTTTQSSAPAAKKESASAQPLVDDPADLVGQCTTAVNTLAGTIPTLTDAQQQAVDAALAQCENVTSLGGITTIINTLTTALMSTTTTPPTTSTTTTPTNPTPLVAPAPAVASSTLAGTDLNCSDFPNQADAQAALVANPSDPNNLDADKDGQACESNAAATANYTGYPQGAVAAGDGSTGGPWLGLLALLGMGGVVGAAGVSKVWFARRGAGV